MWTKLSSIEAEPSQKSCLKKSETASISYIHSPRVPSNLKKHVHYCLWFQLLIREVNGQRKTHMKSIWSLYIWKKIGCVPCPIDELSVLYSSDTLLLQWRTRTYLVNSDDKLTKDFFEKCGAACHIYCRDEGNWKLFWWLINSKNV